MKLLKGIGYILLLLSALLMILLFACAWKPELTEKIADALYGAEVPLAADADDGTGAADRADTADVSDADGGADAAGEAVLSEAVQPIYITPKKEQLVIPEEVSGKTGYQVITDNVSEIGEEDANQLEERLGVGETGDGLNFDSLYYPYYAMLDEKGQHLYRQIYANAKALNQAFSPVEPIKAKQLRNVFAAVYNDHPELFWLDTAYSCKHRANGECVEIDLQFNRTAKNLERENTIFENAAEEILSIARGLTNDYDKERYVHDTLIQKIDYSKSAEMNQSAYSALVNERTVCAGYARAFQYLMQQLQIPCYYCTGYAGENHAWNIIRLEDEYYNVDVTWDDNEAGVSNYFNKTDEDYSDTHVREELSVYLPPCNGQTYRSEDAGDIAEEAKRRSSAEAGFVEEEILHGLEEYYEDCEAKIIQNGKGDFSFANVIEGEALYQEWECAYDSNAYEDAYMVEAMRQIGAKSCHIKLSTEELQQGRYLITHELQLH